MTQLSAFQIIAVYQGFPHHSGSKPDWQLMEPGKTGHHYIAVAREHGLWGICVSDELQDRPIRIPKASDLNRKYNAISHLVSRTERYQFFTLALATKTEGGQIYRRFCDFIIQTAMSL